MNKFLEDLYKECCDNVREKFYRETSPIDSTSVRYIID